MSDIISIAQEGARLAEKATPGPWWINPIEWADNGFGGKEYSEDGGVMCAERMWPDGLDDNYVATGIRYDENSEFIVHAREHYAALCRAVIDAGEREAKLERGIRDAIAHWKIIAGEDLRAPTLVSILEKALSQEHGK